ncbi:neuronal acetylcholine receptor subunit alpha-10 isoform X2 [Nematostella vectensis]|uniref:neuronal acetylcholine receptor subunit alpha-10 isoform X2 n=1 Tax=Nematostella vectensis TaxID=45351 RepID=UPI00207751A2|nr:neuronal acetylcholine receptor subunit alpha-10 isoform X2 [Nematostella vectensis]
MDKTLLFTFALLTIFTPVKPTKDTRAATQELLHNKLFGSGKTRRSFLPRVNESVPVDVEFKFTLINIKDVNAKEQFITVYGWVRQRWTDPFLCWNESKFDDTRELVVDPQQIWVPDILLYNNVDAQDHTAGGRTTYTTDVTLSSEGVATWSSPAIFKCVCNINVIYFPFDEQFCHLKFGSWSLDSSKIRLVNWHLNGKSTSYVKNGEWELLDISSTRNTVEYDTVSFDDITVTIHIGRNFFNYCVNLIIPCALISCMIFLGFILPPESGERIGLSITVLLAMTVFQQLTSQIFPSFDFPLLGQYYFATSVELSLALGASALVINFSFRKTTRMSPFMRRLLLVWLAKVVGLRDTVNKSRPKRPDGSFKGTPRRHNAENTDNRKDDRLVRELNDVISNPGGEYDLGGSHFVNTRGSIKAHTNGTKNKVVFVDDAFEFSGDPASETERSPVVGEDGEELSEEDLTVREWEWKLATRVLDRLFFWMSVLIGLATLFAVFPRAPRLQKAFGF